MMALSTSTMSWLGRGSASVVVVLLLYAVGALSLDVVVPVWKGSGAQVGVRVLVAVALGGMSAWSYLVTGLRTSQRRGEVEAPNAYRTVKRSTGTRRWCSKCNAPKPDRCHHCRKCGTCILRMDHHCPWVMDSCIGLRNYHAFLLFLWYTTGLSVYTLYTLVSAFVRLLERDDEDIALPISWILLAALALIVGMALLPFFIFHVYLTSVNKTTLEYMEGMERVGEENQARDSAPPSSRQRLANLLTREADDEAHEALLPTTSASQLTPAQGQALRKAASRHNLYHVGIAANWRQVLGRSAWLWWAPVETPVCDGVHYRVNNESWVALQGALRAA